MNLPVKAFPQWENHQFMSGFGCDAGEITPFVFKGRRCRVENVMYHSIVDKPVGFNFQEDHFRIRDEESGRPLSHPLVGYYFATAYVHNDVAYVYAADLGPRTAPVWKCQRIAVITSTDLISWTAPQTAIAADHEDLFNNNVTTDGKRFYMVYESDDSRYPVFTVKFAVSDDLIHWDKIPGGLYGRDKYVGGPALKYIAPWFYLTYVNCVNEPSPNGDPEYYDTRIARTRDFIHWEDAPEDRPVLSPDFSHVISPNHPGIYERNASDAEFIEADGKVKVYYAGGNQLGLVDNQTAEFPGTLKTLFESFFNEPSIQ